MKNRKSEEWIWPPADQWITVWGMPLIAIISILSCQLFFFFSGLKGIRWISCYFAALTVAAVGIALLFYAKLPLYRQWRFFTFGSKALPEPRRSFYRWGYGCVALAAALLSLLLISKP